MLRTVYDTNYRALDACENAAPLIPNDQSNSRAKLPPFSPGNLPVFPLALRCPSTVLYKYPALPPHPIAIIIPANMIRYRAAQLTPTLPTRVAALR